MKALLIGAGRAGLGLLVPFLQQSGCSVTVASNNPDSVNILKNGYSLRTPDYTQEIKVDVEHLDHIQGAFNIVATSVGRNNIPDVLEWYKQHGLHAPVLFAENFIQPFSSSAGVLHIPIVIDRICARIETYEENVTVVVENYFKISTLRTRLTERMDIIEQVELLDTEEDVELARKKKMYTVNLAHKLVAIEGLRRGYKLVEQAVADQEITHHIATALEEVAPLLAVNRDEMNRETTCILERFASPIQDPLLRIFNPKKPETAREYIGIPFRELREIGEKAPILEYTLSLVS